MSDDVRRMYERFPYPSPDADSDLIYDTAVALDFVVEDLAGKRVLDAGCGTGHRLVAMASQFPDTEFVGVDFSEHSLAVAADLAARQHCDNVTVAPAEIGGAHLGRRFDVVTSTGVIHHLAEPAMGARWIHDHLEPDGISYVWLYHSFGEFDRLLKREMARLLISTSPGQPDEEILADLRLSLSTRQYGGRTADAGGLDDARLVADVDAYLHPIVHAYRFAEAAALFRGAADWTVVNGVNWDGGSALIDVTDWSGEAHATVAVDTLFPHPRVRAMFDRLDTAGQLRCVELSLRPTGFSVVSGRAAGAGQCTKRLRGVVDLA